MYQFVGLLDVNGLTLEIDRAALEGAGTQLDEIQGRTFWEARWWQVSSETREKQRDLSGEPHVASLSAATLRSMDGLRAKIRS